MWNVEEMDLSDEEVARRNREAEQRKADETAYLVCADCRSLVRIDKPIFGSLHVCVTRCEKRGHHGVGQPRRVGPFWARRDEVRCTDCHDIVCYPKEAR
jgi:hypothetical protein